LKLTSAATFGWYMVEPPIDSETFSGKEYILQMKQGFFELFKNKAVGIQSGVLLMLTAIALMNDEVLIDIQLVEQGWSGEMLSILVAIMYLGAAAASQFTEQVTSIFGATRSVIILALLIAVTMIIIPWLGVIVATVVLLIRNSLWEVMQNATNIVINRATSSQYRATTLSTFSMISNTPYILGAYFVGRGMELYSVNSMTAVLGILLLVLCAGGFVVHRALVPVVGR
jgi:hypothetical protein